MAYPAPGLSLPAERHIGQHSGGTAFSPSASSAYAQSPQLVLASITEKYLDLQYFRCATHSSGASVGRRPAERRRPTAAAG